MANILAVDDEEMILQLIKNGLGKDGHIVTVYSSAKEVPLDTLNYYDLVILDVMMPHIDGFSFCKSIRDFIDCPILFLTAKTMENDITLGLGLGADDYLTKPFHLDELSARIRNLTLRKFTQNDIVLKCSNLSFNTKTRKADVNDEELSLTRKETGILEYLMLNQGRPVSQEELIEHVWDSSVDNFSNSIRVHISSLRKKLRNALGYDPIHNRISEGYVMEEKK